MRTAIVKGFIVLATTAALWRAENAVAQTGSYSQPGVQVETGRFRPAYGFDWGYGPATAAESWYRGYADLVRAWGENNYHNSMAQVYWEQAREKAISNRTAAVEQFFALRRFNEEQRVGAIARGRLPQEKLVEISKKAAPQRLDEAGWNAITDGLAWPAALKSDEFAAASARLDQLFRLRRDSTGGLTDSERSEAQQLVNTMTSELRSMIEQVQPTDYMAAKRFLASVRHETKFDLPSGERLAQK